MGLFDVLDKLPDFESEEIMRQFTKAYSIINGPLYDNIICSISGGSDSDIMLDLIHRVDINKKVTYVWFDTGLEYKATKEHLNYLEDRYGISIQRERAVLPIPACTKKYGQPFLSKYASGMLSRLQAVDFRFEDEPFETLMSRYSNVKGPLMWWCNEYKKRFIAKYENVSENESMFDINRYRYLKEFLIQNPPTFRISNKCCTYAKKAVAHRLIKETNCDLMIIGVRKAEGGIRAGAYKNCYTQGENQYRPLFWFTDSDKREYERAFGIMHSECYTKMGFKRTGCVCCPFGREINYELKQTKIYEPLMYKAVNNVFKDSYEYTKKYRQFVLEQKRKERKLKQLF